MLWRYRIVRKNDEDYFLKFGYQFKAPGWRGFFDSWTTPSFIYSTWEEAKLGVQMMIERDKERTKKVTFEIMEVIEP